LFTASHRHENVRFASQAVGQKAWLDVREIEPELAHHRYDLRMNALTGCGSGRDAARFRRVRNLVEERRGHL
jgi:hypothetical protein